MLNGSYDELFDERTIIPKSKKHLGCQNSQQAWCRKQMMERLGDRTGQLPHVGVPN